MSCRIACAQGSSVYRRPKAKPASLDPFFCPDTASRFYYGASRSSKGPKACSPENIDGYSVIFTTERRKKCSPKRKSSFSSKKTPFKPLLFPLLFKKANTAELLRSLYRSLQSSKFLERQLFGLRAQQTINCHLTACPGRSISQLPF